MRVPASNRLPPDACAGDGRHGLVAPAGKGGGGRSKHAFSSFRGCELRPRANTKEIEMKPRVVGNLLGPPGVWKKENFDQFNERLQTELARTGLIPKPERASALARRRRGENLVDAAAPLLVAEQVRGRIAQDICMKQHNYEKHGGGTPTLSPIPGPSAPAVQ